MKTCRFGHLENPATAFSRAPRCGLDYQAKISGPLFDRIDLLLIVPPVRTADLSLPSAAEGSAQIATRVAAAHERKRLRFTDQEIRVNANADGTLLEEIAAPDNEGRTLLNQNTNRMKLSACGYHRVLRVARTLTAKTVYTASTSRKPYRITGSRRADSWPRLTSMLTL